MGLDQRDERFVVVAIPASDPAGRMTARVGFTGDVMDLLATWKRRHGKMVPVVAKRLDADEALNEIRPPNTCPLEWAAELFGSYPVDDDLRIAILGYVRDTEPHVRSRVVRAWGEAIGRVSVNSPIPESVVG